MQFYQLDIMDSTGERILMSEENRNYTDYGFKCSKCGKELENAEYTYVLSFGHVHISSCDETGTAWDFSREEYVDCLCTACFEKHLEEKIQDKQFLLEIVHRAIDNPESSPNEADGSFQLDIIEYSQGLEIDISKLSKRLQQLQEQSS